MKKNIPCFCMNWHVNQSNAFKKILSEPLCDYMDITYMAWDGMDFTEELCAAANSHPIIIFAFFPPPKNIMELTKSKVCWIPMLDQARGYDQEWWDALPKNLRVVSFSEEVRQKAEGAGLQHLRLKYYLSPDMFKKAEWQKERALFYWNRVGLVGPDFLRKMCRILEVDVLYFRRRLDPGWNQKYDYALDQKMGKTKVVELSFDGKDGHDQYMHYLNKSNIFIAPRRYEGVGLTLIEALAKGCAVFANDAPTMNEYIIHMENGYLFSSTKQPKRQAVIGERIKKKIHVLVNKDQHRKAIKYPICEEQNWREIKKIDLIKIGTNARQAQYLGYEKWIASIPDYARFLLEW